MKSLPVVLLVCGLLVLEGLAAPTLPAKPGKFPDPSLKPDQVIKAEPGTNTYTTTKSKYDGGSFAVYIPKEYTVEKPMPLVVSSHGAGGTGPKEIGGWLRFADKYGFIVVCPSYASATSHGSLARTSATSRILWSACSNR
jgi:predicted dienelactone hydrolase